MTWTFQRMSRSSLLSGIDRPCLSGREHDPSHGHRRLRAEPRPVMRGLYAWSGSIAIELGRCQIQLGTPRGKRGPRLTDRSWGRCFEDPIEVDGHELVALRDASEYIAALLKKEHEVPEWRAAMEALLRVVERGGPTLFARIASCGH